ncbi:glycosyltransferase family 39 protein [Micromonosporaceae bacterium Da 78-11]
MTQTIESTPVPTVEPAEPRRRTWERPALWALLAATAVLYLWNLSASGWGNDFYAAAAQAGSQSWKAWLFASLDSGNAITVDKPPAALWVMGLSARIFGVNSWAMLAPQALMGVGSVALLYATVRRWSGPAAGLLAGAVLALTPVAVVMFRFDNPDALLVLLMTGAAYATVRAVETASWKWLALAGVLLGFGFLTKMLQAFLVLPGFALVYLVAAPTGLARRVRDLLISGLALVLSGGWFVLLVSLWPASSRPYIAGSTNNSLWQLAIGYNGLGRILGGEGNGGGGGAPGGGGPGGGAPGGGGGFGGGGNTMFGGEPGIGRMFGSSFGLEISWLLPTALVALVALLAVSWRTPRTDRVRAAALLWGSWTVVTALTFSFMSGTVHPYYAIALAPGIAALVAVGTRELWARRERITARAALAALVLVTVGWDFVLLGRVDWAPGLRWVALIAGVLAAAGLVVPLALLRRVGVVLVAAVAVLAVSAGGAAWAVSTAGVAHTGATPTAGPAGLSTGGFGGRGRYRGTFPSGAPDGGAQGGVPGGGAQGGFPGGAGPGGGTGRGGFGGQSVDAELVALVRATGNRWAAATNGSMQAAPLELASGKAVMAIGGFTGSDNSPTLAQFQAYVAGGQVHYYLAGGRGGGRGGPGGGGQGAGTQIEEWVTANFAATTVGSSTVYDLTAATTS